MAITSDGTPPKTGQNPPAFPMAPGFLRLFCGLVQEFEGTKVGRQISSEIKRLREGNQQENQGNTIGQLRKFTMCLCLFFNGGARIEINSWLAKVGEHYLLECDCDVIFGLIKGDTSN